MNEKEAADLGRNYARNCSPMERDTHTYLQSVDLQWQPHAWVVRAIRDAYRQGASAQAQVPAPAPVSFEQAALPLIKWLAENVHPHHTAIVTSDSAELAEGKIVIRTNEYLKE
jgi:hypothetical protein